MHNPNKYPLPKMYCLRTFNTKASSGRRVVAEASCPTCKADKGFMCISNTGNKCATYHSHRFNAYIKTKDK